MLDLHAAARGRRAYVWLWGAMLVSALRMVRVITDSSELFREKEWACSCGWSDRRHGHVIDDVDSCAWNSRHICAWLKSFSLKKCINRLFCLYLFNNFHACVVARQS